MLASTLINWFSVLHTYNSSEASFTPITSTVDTDFGSVSNLNTNNVNVTSTLETSSVSGASTFPDENTTGFVSNNLHDSFKVIHF